MKYVSNALGRPVVDFRGPPWGKSPVIYLNSMKGFVIDSKYTDQSLCMQSMFLVGLVAAGGGFAEAATQVRKAAYLILSSQIPERPELPMRDLHPLILLPHYGTISNENKVISLHRHVFAERSVSAAKWEDKKMVLPTQRSTVPPQHKLTKVIQFLAPSGMCKLAG